AAKRLMVKIVNSLSALREIGAPAVCSYLLGYPDHYTNCHFKIFFWYSYVKQTLRDVDSTMLESVERDEDVILSKHEKSVIGITKVQDYVYRPSELEEWSLYEYLRSGLDVDEPDHSDDSEDEPDDTDPKVDVKRNNVYRLQEGHPLSQTHAVVLLTTSTKPILTFAGGNLPRRDRGDREFYCAAMLTMFAPRGWRKGQDLLKDHGSWSSAFEATQFPEEYVQVMNNMNVLYECTDARDDYSAQLRSGKFVVDPEMNEGTVPIRREVAEEALPEFMDLIHTEKDLLDLLEDSSRYINIEHNRRVTEIEEMKRLLTRIGYGEIHLTNHNMGQDDTLEWRIQRQSTEFWKNNVSAAKEQVIQSRQLQVYMNAQTFNRADAVNNNSFASGVGVQMTDSYVDAVYVVTKHDLESSESVAIDRPLQDSSIAILTSVLEEFSLNREQERAFLMIAYKVHRQDPGQLKMYIGGMAGTGKSRVLKTLISFMERRGESRRLYVMAPTGSAACLVDGSTYHSALSLGRNFDVLKGMDSDRLSKLR
ncbi:hypothetical protein C8Q73DRAFT_625331, partial [Cubamyces lactineus]